LNRRPPLDDIAPPVDVTRRSSSAGSLSGAGEPPPDHRSRRVRRQIVGLPTAAAVRAAGPPSPSDVPSGRRVYYQKILVRLQREAEANARQPARYRCCPPGRTRPGDAGRPLAAWARARRAAWRRAVLSPSAACRVDASESRDGPCLSRQLTRTGAARIGSDHQARDAPQVADDCLRRRVPRPRLGNQPGGRGNARRTGVPLQNAGRSQWLTYTLPESLRRMLHLIPHALALVRVGLAQLADVRCPLPTLLVDAIDRGRVGSRT